MIAWLLLILVTVASFMVAGVLLVMTLASMGLL